MAQNNKGNKKQNKQHNKKEKGSQKKKSGAKNRSSVYCYLFGSFILICAIAGVIGYDYHTHGGVFEKCNTGKFLKDTGALPYVEVAWYKTISTSARGYKWMEENIPTCYAIVKETMKPYCNLMVDLGKIALNTVKNFGEAISEVFSKKGPVVGEYVDQYVPGISKKVTDLSVFVWSTSVDVFHNSCDFFKTKVFIGSLSPESLSKYMKSVQIAAAKYYSWFHEKVDDYAKIK